MKYGIGNPSSIDLFRERTAASPPLRLTRRRCACGKVVTAKQLQQYQACAACVRAAATNKLKEAA